MNTMTKFVFVTLALGSMTPVSVFADGCPDSEIAAEKAILKKAEDSEKAGKLKDAFNTAKSIGECLGNEAGQRRDAVIRRSGKTLGMQEEKTGRLQEAFDWYEKSGNKDEADRIKLKQVQLKPDDTGTVGGAISHFTYRNNGERVKELRAMASRNVDKWLAAEEKAFTARKDSRDELGKARDWVYYAQAGSAKVNERAEKRGDTLAADNSRRSIGNAIAYFEFAEKTQKAKGVRDKARKLGDEHARKSENKLAVEFYELAGDSAKAEGLAKKTEAEGEKAEAKRQDKFKQDQKSLEKELGL